MNDLLEMANRLDPDFQIVKAKKIENQWYLEIVAEEESGTNGLEICRKLNGWNNKDYFSIIGFETKGAMIYRVITKRVRDV